MYSPYKCALGLAFLASFVSVHAHHKEYVGKRPGVHQQDYDGDVIIINRRNHPVIEEYELGGVNYKAYEQLREIVLAFLDDTMAMIQEEAYITNQ
ncbi:Uu.00g007400.m01.CDS01 [Anthostomella pinea]|uniref:Uu.00g007400.m01.CDS01 n=1 Tax=Anthostomella pinea TaxID=933095 RepID=A0AAI8YPW7_9PEZI|nr:Uu.00g007400.m01.CDS01 [Anthostomella pinea]